MLLKSILFHPLFKWFHSSQLFYKGYPSIIERKHYVRSPRLLKTALFSFERRLATHKKKISKEIE